MQTSYSSNTPDGSSNRGIRPRHDRGETARHVQELRSAQASGQSERDFARQARVARTSLRHWNERRRRLEAAGVPAFLETSEGVAWLTRLVWALVFVMTVRCPSGIRVICEVLELSGLDEVVGSSFGSIQRMSGQLLGAVGEVGEELQQHLCKAAADEPPRRITLCQDETFHPQVCLVAVEPVSGFVVLEQYAERRDAATWSAATLQSLADLPVQVVQSTSDEAQALKKQARQDLQAHHSPDLFHVQHEAHKATALALKSRQIDAESKAQAAQDDVETLLRQRESSSQRKRQRGRPIDYDRHIEVATAAARTAQAAAQQAAADREAVRRAIASISTVYHPYDLQTGVAQSADTVASRLSECFTQIDEVAERAGLSQRCLDRIDKAWRVTDDMHRTIEWTHIEMGIRLSVLDLSALERQPVQDKLIPSLYLRSVAARAGSADKRDELREVADRLLAAFDQAAAALPSLDQRRRALVIEVAQQCADAFQRSSSCVEGRNGHLSLFHHGVHRLLPDKLTALTVVHNFHVKRPDGSTAAERFFRRGHRSLFEAVLERLPAPARPARPRAARRRPGVRPKGDQHGVWTKR